MKREREREGERLRLRLREMNEEAWNPQGCTMGQSTANSLDDPDSMAPRSNARYTHTCHNK